MDELPFCENCGNKISDKARFCTNCGTEIKKYEPKEAKREVTYDGVVHKCPNCGEVLKPFDSACPSCGYEIQGKKASNSIVEFSNKLSKIEKDSERRVFIRNYPIPNSREDIIEFMLIIASNFDVDYNPKLINSWIAKLEQCYQKALLVIKDESELEQIRKIYDECHAKMRLDKYKKIIRSVVGMIVRNIPVFVTIVVWLAGVSIDRSDGDSSMCEMTAMILMIVNACALKKRSASTMDYIVVILGAFLTWGISYLYEDGSAAELGAVTTIIIAAVNYFRGLGTKIKEEW